MRFLTLLAVAGLAIASSGQLSGQSVSESLEREARSAFKTGRFRDAANKFQDAAASAPEMARRGKMELQAAWSFFNDRNLRAAREAIRRAFGVDPGLEVVPEFYSPEFLKLVDDIRSALRSAPAIPPPPVDLAELKRVSEEKLKDGRSAEVIYDLTNLPPGRLDPEMWALLARAYEASGQTAEAAATRRRAALPAAATPPTGAPPAVSAPPLPQPVSSPPGPSPPPPASRSVGQPPAVLETLAGGRAALQRGDAFQAQSAANRAIEMEPNSSEAYRLLGDAYLARGEKALAEANWRQSLKLDEKNEATLLTLSDFQLAETNWASAIETLGKAASLNSANAERLLALGRKVREAHDLPHAVLVFAAAAKLFPNDGALQTELAATLVEAGDLNAALEPLMKAAAIFPNSAVARGNLAAVLRRKGLRREAEREYREALRIDSGYLPALSGLGCLLLGGGQAREAAGFFEHASLLDPANAGLVLGLTRARKAIDGPEAAAAILERATSLNDSELWNEAGAIAYERERYGEAAGYFDNAVTKDAASSIYKSNRDRARAVAAFLSAAGIELSKP